MDQAAQLQEMLNGLGGTVNNTSGAFQQLAQALTSAARAGGQNATATTVATQAMQQFQQRQQNVSQAMSSLGSTAFGLINGFSNITSNLYGADKAFTSVIPTLSLVTETLTKTIENMGKALSGATIGIAGFTFSLGRASEAIAAGLIKPIEAASGLIKFELEASQKVADAFLDVAKNGALFGASIGEMARYAAQANVPLQSFQRIIGENVENIGKLGLGMQNGAFYVAAMGREIMKTNPRMIALYGSVENISAATADYLALQAQLGIDVRKNAEQQIAGANEYLIRQRELSAITGKTAANLKREEEERQNQLDYQLKSARLDDNARANLRESMGVAGKLFGPTGQKYLEEYFATGGQVYSEQALKYEALNTEAASAMQSMISGIGQGRDAFRQNYQEYLKANSPALEAYGKSLENMAEINRAANNSTIKLMTDTGTAIISNLTMIKEGLASVELDKFRNDMKTTVTSLDGATQGFLAAQEALTQNQAMIDQIVLANMGKMADVVNALNKINVMILSGQDAALEALNGVFDAASKGKAAMEQYSKDWQVKMEQGLLDAIGKAVGNTRLREDFTPDLTPRSTIPGPATISNSRVAEADALIDELLSRVPNASQASMPKKADGGIATTPSIAGEAGPEAVIPLKGGKIPLQIDFDPVIRALETNNDLIERLNRNMEDSKDIQKQILNASY